MEKVIVTKEQIADWKEAHGEVIEIKVAVAPTDYDPHMLTNDDVQQVEHISAFIQPPSDKTLNFALQNIAKPQDAGAIILKNSWLGGDERIKTERDFLIPAAMQCLDLIQIRQAKIVKH